MYGFVSINSIFRSIIFKITLKPEGAFHFISKSHTFEKEKKTLRVVDNKKYSDAGKRRQMVLFVF